jgi:hypothetical protein
MMSARAGGSETSLSEVRKNAAAINAQGIRKISTPEAWPNTLALNIVLAIPVSGSKALPSTVDRRATIGTRMKKGGRQKGEACRQRMLTDGKIDVERVKRLVRSDNQRDQVTCGNELIFMRGIGYDALP